MNANLTYRLQEDQETSVIGSDLEEEEEEVQLLIFGIGDRWRLWEGYPDIMQ